MQLEDYFEFEKFETKFGPAERIRIKGHRISIEHVIEKFKEGMPAEEILRHFPTLSLEQVFATLTYYLHAKEEIEDYIRRGEAIEDAFYQEYLQQEPPPVIKRLRELKAQRQAAEQATDGEAPLSS